MKKTAMALGIMIGAMGAANAGPVGQKGHVDGVVNVLSEQSVTVTVDDPEATVRPDLIGDGYIVTTAHVKPSESAKIWFGLTDYQEGDTGGKGVMRTTDGRTAGLEVWGGNMTEMTGEGGRPVLVSNYECKESMDCYYRVRLIASGAGLPETGAQYHYGIDAGVWSD